MIYQDNNEFKVFTILATFNNQSRYIRNVEQFESELLEHIRNESFNSESETNDVVLPEIIYTDVNLSDEQLDRFNIISYLSSVTLRQVVEYVLEGIEPINIEYQIMNMQDENAELLFRNAMNEMSIDSLQGENSELLFKNAINEMSIESIQDENAMLMFRVANLETGGN